MKAKAHKRRKKPVHIPLGKIEPKHVTEPLVVVAVPKSTWQKFLDRFNF